ncbi:MAG TPA: hypothetical protein VFL81_02755 [Candidatus Saccharimonadales bacterium]|nr:hypothetical protein [Candidatus Saccharimonadales bacterium]
MVQQLDQDQTARSTQPEVSVGAGIAIAGVWLAGSATTILLSMMAFVWSAQPTTEQAQEAASSGIWILIILLALPMAAAYWATKLILGKE